MKYHTSAILVICLILATGSVAAGTLTLTLEPSLDGKGDIRATSITDAKLCDFQGICVLNGIPYKTATITNGTAKFSLSDRDAGARLILINNLNDDLIPTRIDPTKDIHQFVGQKLRVSVIGNLSDPTYRIETFTIGQGYDHPAVSYSDGNYSPEVLGPFDGDVYTVLSLNTNPSFQVITLGAPRLGREQTIIDYTSSALIHPNTTTSINPSFSKWMFGEGSHGNDYGGNDSKCSTCHGDLDSKPAKFSDITINNGFCFRCHYGKGGVEKGFTVDTIGLGVGTPAPTTANPIAALKPTATIPKVKFITAGDDAGKTTTLQINETVLITLEEGFYDWNITVDNQTVLNLVPGTIIRGAQGVYQARSLGRATLIAKGDPICLKSKPACGAASIGLIFHVIVSDEPAPKPTAILTPIAAPKTPAFEALSAIATLLAVLLIGRK